MSDHIKAAFPDLENLAATINTAFAQLNQLDESWQSFARGVMPTALADGSGEQFQATNDFIANVVLQCREFLGALGPAVQQAMMSLENAVMVSRMGLARVGP